MSQIGRVVELENLKQMRQAVAQRVINAKKTLQEKTRLDNERQKELSEKVEHLEEKLNEAEEEMLLDGLTQVFNRRAFDKRIKEEVGRGKVLGASFGLLLIDIDHFKNVNDTHGHPIGDRLLMALARDAKNALRVDDFVARYGGEEFVMILPGPSIDVVFEVADRIRETVAKKEFRYKKTDDGRIETFGVTISGGIAWYRQEDTPESLTTRADQCLYLAKNSGRDQIRIESDLEKADT